MLLPRFPVSFLKIPDSISYNYIGEFSDLGLLLILLN